MEENVKKKTKSKKRTRDSGRKLGNAIKEFLGGEILKVSTFRLFPFLAFITFLAFIYIANNYYAERKIREINKLRKELKEIRYEYITTKSKLTELTKQSQLAKRLDHTGIKESTDPIKTIRDFIKSKTLFSNLEKEHDYTIKYYRPPYGKYNIISLCLYLMYNKTPVFWHIDPKDYNAENPDSIVRYIGENAGSGGKVVLLHDGRYGENNTAKITVDAVRSLFNSPATSAFHYAVNRYQ